MSYPKTYAGAALEEIGRAMKKGKTPHPYDGWSTMSPDQPRKCYVCGYPVRLSESVGFRQQEPLASWHLDCATGPPR